MEELFSHKKHKVIYQKDKLFSFYCFANFVPFVANVFEAGEVRAGSRTSCLAGDLCLVVQLEAVSD